MRKFGRPTKWPEPNTLLAERLQSILPDEGLGKLSANYFAGAAQKTVAKYLSGEIEPPPSSLVGISEKCNCELIWLLTGKNEDPQKKSPPARATGTGMCGALRDPLAPDAGSRILDFLSEKLPPEQRLMLEFIWYNLMRAEGKARLALAKTQDERGLIGFEVFENTAKCGQVIYALCTSLGFDPNVPYGTPVPPDKSDT